MHSHHDSIALQPHDRFDRFTGGAALLGRFDAVIDGIANQVPERRIEACQNVAIDLRRLDAQALGERTRAIHARIRATVPVLDVDRPLGPDVEAIAMRIAAGDFVEAAGRP